MGENYQPKQGFIPALKSAIWGDPEFSKGTPAKLEEKVGLGPSNGHGTPEFIPAELSQAANYTTQTFFQWLAGSHSFNRMALYNLVETGYTRNDAGFSAVQKILFAQQNLNYIPYWKGKPWKSKVFDFDTWKAALMLCTCGTIFIQKKKRPGFDDLLYVHNTLDIIETYSGGSYTYQVDLRNGRWENIPIDELIIIKWEDISSLTKTQFGLSPLQAAVMAIQAMEQMYVANVSLLKNKGADVLISNDSDDPIKASEKGTASEIINREVSGARRSGSVAVSTHKWKVQNLGRSVKDLQIWDGTKITARAICNVLQLSTSLFNDPDNKTFANYQDSQIALYTECVIPLMKRILENKELKAALGYDVYIDVSNISCLQKSQADKAATATTNTDNIIKLNEKVKAGSITREIAISILVTDWGYDQEEAGNIIMQAPTEVAPPEPPVVE